MREVRITQKIAVKTTAEKRTLDRLGQQGVDNDNDDNKRMELRENDIMAKPNVAQEWNLCCTVVVRE